MKRPLTCVNLNKAIYRLSDVRAKCLRLFAYRKRQPWPPTVAAGPDWGSVYEAALDTMQDKTGVLPTVDEAVAWANDLIAKIDAAAPKRRPPPPKGQRP